MRSHRARLAVFCVLSWTLIVLCQSSLPWVPATAFLMAATIVHTAGMSISALYRTRRPQDAEQRQFPFVSIVIPAHNEARVIAATVRNMMELDYPDFEVLVADDRSTDGTGEEVAPLLNNWPGRLRLFRRPDSARPGKSAVLNDALKMCHGEVICVFDAEARVAPDFLRRIVLLLNSPRTGAVQARKVYRNADSNTITRLLNAEYRLDAYFLEDRMRRGSGADMRGNGQVIRRRALEEINGWNERTLTDDMDLSLRLHLANWDIAFAADVPVTEEAVTTVHHLLRQRRRWVEGAVRSYLDYLPSLCARHMPLRKKMDTIVYSMGLVIPFWLVSDIIVQGIRMAAGCGQCTGAPFALFPVMVLFLTIHGVCASRRFERMAWRDALATSFECAVGMAVVWSAMVLYVVVRILFLKERFVWAKTPHGVSR